MLIEVEHAPGSLAKVLAKVGEAGLTVEDLHAIHRTQDKTTWELGVELDDASQRDLSSRVNALPNARVLGLSDRVFDHHEGGKIRVQSEVAFEDMRILKDVYTPGVARVCLAIQQQPELARRYTNLAKTVAIVTNGTAILGLGDIGPVAGLPVMEGKAALFSVFGGLSGVPILIGSKSPKQIIETVVSIAPSFGAIQLEDIAAPECFEIEQELIRRLPGTPVLHDDQHGTAVVVLAALLSAARLTGVSLSESSVGQIGLGAAGIGIVSLLQAYGVKRVLGSDLAPDARQRLERLGGVVMELEQLMAEADVVIATTGVAGLIRPDWIRAGQIVFALSNPDPEIEPRDALRAGARFAADGKNINNVLAFPGLFRGALDAAAAIFTNAMLIRAAEAISAQAPPDQLIPSPLDRVVHERVAEAVADAVLAATPESEQIRNSSRALVHGHRQALLDTLAQDEALQFKAVVRRNRLLAEWAAEKLGKDSTERRAYQREVLESDFEEEGDEDVLRKLAADLASAGIDATDVRAKMDELLVQALYQLSAEEQR